MNRTDCNLNRWVKISKADGLPVSKSLLYKWRHRKENLQIFSKIGGGVFVDVEALEKLLENSRAA